MKSPRFWCQYRRPLVFAIVALGALASSGCVKWEDRARLYLASSVDVFAVVGTQLLID
ncbi:MAG: hypothetical protein H7293_07590 [Candidatus Saccharibacteria bacterium]|nr:hypothetical protein [Rhodoferax sp.]